jgi:cytochrome c oxidase accessory protein FixG
VQVCPTGIDIRDGLQYQCIGCAHCVDACDQVMDKMGYDRGLVSYTTEHALAGGRTHWLRPRSIGYATALLIMIVAFSVAITSRVPFEVDVLRERGELYRLTAGDQVANQYRLRVLNKSQQTQAFELSLESALPLTADVDEVLAVAPGELLDQPLKLSTAKASIALPSTPVTVRLCEQASGHCRQQRSSFLGPTP